MNNDTDPNSEASATDPGSLPTSMYSNPFTHTGIGLKGIQINLRRSQVATTNLIDKCNHIKSCVLFIQEPMTVKNQLGGIPRSLKQHYASHEHIRAALCHTSDLTILDMPTFTDRDVVTCLWAQPKKNSAVVIISAYWDCTNPNIPDKLVNAIQYANDKHYPILCCIDSNAHSTVWGSPSDNTRGRTFEEFMIEQDLDVNNIGNQPTFRNEQGAQSIIDLTLTSNRYDRLIRNWTISKTYFGSDHKMIHFTMESTKIKPITTYNYNKCNWTSFRAHLQADWPEQPITWTSNDIDSEAELIQKRILGSLSISCPKSKNQTRVKLGWWTNELHKLKRKARVSYHRNELAPNEDNRKEYDADKKHYKKILRKTKRQHFRQKCTDISDFKTLSKLNKALQQHNNNKHLGMVYNSQGEMTESVEEMADVLLDTHFPGSTKHRLPDIKIECTTAPFHDWINPDSCKAAINRFKNDKAAGPDQIKPIVLKNLPDNVILRLCTLFSATIDTGYTPEIWRHSRAILIPKPGKDDYTNPNSFRPISLTSFMFKTLERLVLWRLEDTALKQNPMHKNQHAFRRGHSTEIPLSELTNFIEQAFINKEYVVSVFLDIIGAFNNVSHQAMERAMIKHGFPPDIIQWYLFYTKNRTVEFNTGSQQFIRHLVDGFAQGGILSPPIFDLSINDILIITFDPKLTFTKHINSKFAKTKRILFSARNAIGQFWGPKPILTKWLYTNIVRPTFTYGCIAWAKATRTKLFKNKAKRLQRLGLKCIAPIREHSPTSGL
jgi:hypothetical protein